MTLTRQAARQSLATGRAPVAPEVREKVALCLRDFFSCCLATKGGTAGQKIAAFSAARPGPPEAYHFGLAYKVSAESAALGNAMLGHSLIREDMHVNGGSHAGVVILPALLALAQRERLPGKALVCGIVAGYQMMAVLGGAVRAGQTNKHFRPIGITGPFAACAGAVAATGMDEDAAVHALGFAANFGGGLNEWPWCGGEDIYVHAGMAARNALTALDLARAGLVSSETVLEGADGFLAAYGAGPQAAEVFASRLAQANAILQVRHKPVAGCNFIQTPVAAALRLRARLEGGATSAISRITVTTFTAARDYPGCNYAGAFSSIQQSKMSLQYGVSAALRFGELSDAAYSQHGDAELQRLIAACDVGVDPAYDAAYPRAQPARVTVQFADGRVLEQALDDVPWLDDAGVNARYVTEARLHAAADSVAQVDALLSGLWDLTDLSPLFDALAQWK